MVRAGEGDAIGLRTAVARRTQSAASQQHQHPERNGWQTAIRHRRTHDAASADFAAEAGGAGNVAVCAGEALPRGPGLHVKGEICGCDLVALRGDEPPRVVIGELKLGFNLELVLQAINRTAACDEIWLAVRVYGRRPRARPARAQALPVPRLRASRRVGDRAGRSARRAGALASSPGCAAARASRRVSTDAVSVIRFSAGCPRRQS